MKALSGPAKPERRSPVSTSSVRGEEIANAPSLVLQTLAFKHFVRQRFGRTNNPDAEGDKVPEFGATIRAKQTGIVKHTFLGNLCVQALPSISPYERISIEVVGGTGLEDVSCYASNVREAFWRPFDSGMSICAMPERSSASSYPTKWSTIWVARSPESRSLSTSHGS